jgi:hypothetical protein
MKEKISVVDNNTNGILCECTSHSLAHSISSGFINSSVKILPSNLPWRFQEFNMDLDNQDIHYQFSNGAVLEMNTILITEKWIKLKNLSRLRRDFQLAWETRCKMYLLNRNVEYPYSSEFEGFLWRELDRCDPASNFYTQPIVEWAALSDLDISTAYQELKLKAESRGLQYIRNHAIHQKFVFLLNQETTLEGFRSVLADGIGNLINKAQI